MACIDYGFLLVSLDDDTENTFVVDTAYTFAVTEWWTGYNDTDVEGVFTWANGSPATYTRFSGGEPNDSLGMEDCVTLGRFGDYTWNDATCSNLAHYICESE